MKTRINYARALPLLLSALVSLTVLFMLRHQMAAHWQGLVSGFLALVVVMALYPHTADAYRMIRITLKAFDDDNTNPPTNKHDRSA